MALLLIGLFPFVSATVSLPLFLSLPIYMLHQYEEHDDNRFARFLNGMMGSDKRGLSSASIWIINIVFVWFLLLAVFYLAALNASWGVLAGYLLAINGFVHVVWAVSFRAYNPGLATAAVLFIPCAIWIFLTTAATPLIHVVSAVLVIGLHACIMVLARRPA